MARTLAGRLVEALFSGLPNRKRRVAVYTAYSDESGSGDGRGLFLMAGYAASSEFWPCVVDAWQERVLEAPPKIPYLHVSEIRHEKFRKKHTIAAWQAESKIETAIDILRASGGLQGAVASIDVATLEAVRIQFKSASGKRPGYSLREPDYVCYLEYAYSVLDEVHAAFPDVESVDFVVSIKTKVTDHIKHFHEDLRTALDRHRPDLAALVGRLIPDDMRRAPGLQMADVLCWQLRTCMEKQAMDRNLWKLEIASARHIRHCHNGGQYLGEVRQSIMKRVET